MFNWVRSISHDFFSFFYFEIWITLWVCWRSFCRNWKFTFICFLLNCLHNSLLIVMLAYAVGFSRPILLSVLLVWCGVLFQPFDLNSPFAVDENYADRSAGSSSCLPFGEKNFAFKVRFWSLDFFNCSYFNYCFVFSDSGIMLFCSQSAREAKQAVGQEIQGVKGSFPFFF